MAIVMDVLTHLDERSMADASRQLKSHFEEGGHETGEKFGSNLIEGVMAGFNGGEFESLGGVFESAGIAAKATRSGEAIGLAFATGITVAAGAALVDLGVKVGETFEGINRQIELHTAASGKALDDLKSHADALVGSLDSATDHVGSDVATLATRLQMTAGPALDQLTQHVEMLRDRFGDINVGALAGAFRNLGVDGAQADTTLASLVETSRRYSIALPDMVNNLAGFSSTFSQLHLSAEQSANVLGEVEANGVPAARAMTGLESAMGKAKDQGQDFTTFVGRAAAGIEAYQRAGNEAAAQAISVDVFGTKKWAEADIAAHAYLDTVRQSPQAFAGNSAQLDDLGKNTRNLGNLWQEVKNKIDAALQPTGSGVTDQVSQKIEELLGFIDAHQQDLRNMFEGAVDVVEHVVSALANVTTFLERHPGLIQAIAVAFGTWEAIKGVDFVLTGLEAVGAWLVGAPAVAATSAAGVDAAMTGMAAATTAAGGEMALAFGPVMGELAAMPAEAEVAGTAIATSMTAADGAVLALNASLDTVMATLAGFAAAAAPFLAVAGGVAALMGLATATGSATGQEDTPDYTRGGQVALGPDGKPLLGPDGKPITAGMGRGSAPGPGTGRFAPGQGPDVGGRAAPVLPGAPVVPGTSASPDPEAPLTLADLDPKKKGPRLPQAPEMPMPAGYGAAPRPGETAEQYEAEQRVLEQRHNVDEASARLNQLEKDNNATADDIQKARNDLLKAQGDQNSAELRLYQEQTRQLGKHADEMGELGAKIDKDFGVSKGLSGIADNLTKFLGNLMMAGPLAALNQMVEASGVKQAAPGAGGLLGMAAVSGAFGPQFMAGGVPAGMPQGPFGGYPGARGGFGGASFTSPGMPSIRSAGDVAAAGTGVAALYQFAESLEGTPYSMQLRNDCSGMVSRIASEAVGLGDPAAGQRFSTANEGEWLASHGFQSGMGGPDDLNIGWHQGGPGGGHTAATLPGGVNAEQGGANPSFTLGPGAAGAGNPEFEFHAHLPMGGQGPLQGPGAIPGAPMNTDASGAVIGAPSAFRPRGTDTIPAMLSPGEEVAQTSAVHKYGAGTYDAMNKGLVDPTSIRYLSGGSDGALDPDQTQGPTQIGGAAANAGEGSGMPGGGSAAQAGASAIGGAAAPTGGGGGMSAVGGGLAAGAGAGAATLGIGLAAQIAMQEAQRAIQYGGALAGIGAEGLMETFLPTGGSQLAQNSWLTKIAGGLMGAQPQIPNMAGKSQNKAPEGVSGMGPAPLQPPGPQPASVVAPQPTPESVIQGAQAPPQGTANGMQGGGQPGAGGSNAPAVYIEQYHAHDDPNSAGQDIARHTVATNAPSRGTSQWS